MQDNIQMEIPRKRPLKAQHKNVYKYVPNITSNEETEEWRPLFFYFSALESSSFHDSLAGERAFHKKCICE